MFVVLKVPYALQNKHDSTNTFDKVFVDINKKKRDKSVTLKSNISGKEKDVENIRIC